MRLCVCVHTSTCSHASAHRERGVNEVLYKEHTRVDGRACLRAVRRRRRAHRVRLVYAGVYIRHATCVCVYSVQKLHVMIMVCVCGRVCVIVWLHASPRLSYRTR